MLLELLYAADVVSPVMLSAKFIIRGRSACNSRLANTPHAGMPAASCGLR
jgi:hypothetical protein